MGNYNSSNTSLILLGDPEMQVWTNTPQNLQVSVSPQPLVTGENTVTVTINSVFPAGEGATICLQKGEEIYAVKSSAQTGSHTFTVTPHTMGMMYVTVTAHNFIPYESTVPVHTGQHSLYISGITMEDDGSNGSNGNGNGKIEAGETIALSIDLKNSGATTASNVSALLVCPSYEIATQTATASFGTITPGMTKTSLNRFVFSVDNSAEEKLKDDANPVRFFLNITDNSGNTYSDDFTIDLFVSNISQGNKTIVSTSDGDTNIEPGETVQINIDLTNTGGGDATGLTAVLSSNSSYVTSCSSVPRAYPTIGKNETGTSLTPFIFTVSNTYNASLPLNFNLAVENEFGKIWTFGFNLADRPGVIPVNSISSIADVTEIELFWIHQTGAAGYNIYRSDVDSAGDPVGNYVKVNNFPVSAAYFKDSGLNQLTKYAYRISGVSASGNEGGLSSPLIAWTSYATKGLFPIQMNTSGAVRIKGSINVSDVNNDGYPEIFTCTDGGDASRKGYLIGLNHEGIELFDIDNNITTYSGFAYFNASVQAQVAIGDLYATGEEQIVSVTRDMSASRANHITCHAVKDTDGDHMPDVLWQNPTNFSYIKGAVISNVDNSSDGSLEIILKPDGNSAGFPDGDKIQVLDNQGGLLYSFGHNCNYTALAVADLDGDGDKEIIAGYPDGIYVWHHDGTAFSQNPLFTRNTHRFDSSPVICDLDNDGEKEIIMAARNPGSTESTIFAVKLDGSLVPGWQNGSQKIPMYTSSVTHDISVGDLMQNGELNVVCLGSGVLKAWNKSGEEILSVSDSDFSYSAYSTGYTVPILADVDGDSQCEMVFAQESKKKIHAIKLDGSEALGFPLQTENEIIACVAVSDVDGNGKNEVIAGSNGKIYMWETNGSPDCIEWGSERHDFWNTGEYFEICKKTIIKENMTWNSNLDVCNNIIVESGTLTIGASCTLTMSESSMIIVKPGANLVIDGGEILDAYIKALPQSSVTLRNNGYVKLRRKGEFNITLGAIFNYLQGNIDITP